MPKRRARGEGSIFKEKTGFWRAHITFPDGTRKYKRSKRQSVVREWLQEQRQAMQTNTLLNDDKILFGDYLEHFIEAVVVHTLAPTSIHTYQHLIRNHIIPELGHIRLVNLRPDHLQSLYSLKLESGLSKRTVQYIHAVIRRSLNQTVKWGLLYRNPTDAVTAPSPKRKPPQTLSAEQAKLFLKSVEGHTYFPIYLLAIMLGMRKGELLGLQWPNVNLENKTISVRHTLIDVQGKRHLGQPKSATAKRTISISDTVCEALRNIDNDEGFVFKSALGNPISQRNLTRHFHNTLDKLGFPRMPFHNLRHTCATYYFKRMSIHASYKKCWATHPSF